MSTFEPGTVVQLRSGGPLLTVSGSSGENVNVIYYNTVTGTYSNFITVQACLRPANAAPQVPQDANTLRHTSVTKSTMSS